MEYQLFHDGDLFGDCVVSAVASPGSGLYRELTARGREEPGKSVRLLGSGVPGSRFMM